MSFYVDQNGYSSSHWWFQSFATPGRYRVIGYIDFTREGYAVVDDFGNLVEVKA